jgi:uncharacterized glyoxalase superfamily protein PhnB
MKPLDLAKKLRRDAAFEPAVLERGKAALMAAIRQEVAPTRRLAIVPQLPYQNTRAALAFLQRVFGFREIPATQIVSADGALLHTMLEFGGGESQFISVQVEDVDAHYRRAVAAGARIVDELRDHSWGERTYWALDLEGHRWRFGQPRR